MANPLKMAKYIAQNKELIKEVGLNVGHNIASVGGAGYIKAASGGAAAGGLAGGVHSSLNDQGFWSGATKGAFQGAIGGLTGKAFIGGSFKAGVGGFPKGSGNVGTAAKQYWNAFGGSGVSKQVVALQRLGVDASKAKSFTRGSYVNGTLW